MRRRLNPRLLILFMVLLILFISSSIVVYYRLSKTKVHSLEQANNQLVWLTAQSKYNLFRFNDTLWQYLTDTKNVNHDDLINKFDIFWGSYHVLTQGRAGQALQEFSPLFNQVDEILQLIEKEVVTLSPGDMVKGRLIHAQTLDLLELMRELVIQVLDLNLKALRVEQEKYNAFLWSFGIFYIGVLTCGICLSLLLNQEIRKSHEFEQQALSASATKSLFLANMSHEFRTPLNAILGFSEIMKTQMDQQKLPPKYREYAEFIHKSGSHLLELVNHVLAFAKVESGETILNAVSVDLYILAKEVFGLMHHGAEKKKINYILEQRSRSLVVKADPMAVRQMLINLLSNAIKFTPEEGEVAMRFKDRRHSIEVIVEDTGCGIEPNDIPKVLVPFGQVDQRLSKPIEGVGLGLPLVKALIEAHNGELVLKSVPKKGTAVTLVFPKTENS